MRMRKKKTLTLPSPAKSGRGGKKLAGDAATGLLPLYAGEGGAHRFGHRSGGRMRVFFQ
jgi:hypothetical protein